MTTSPLFLLTICLLPAAAFAQEQAPESRRGDVVRTYHGREVAEPYAWLEEMGSAPVRAWARKQDDYARRFLLDESAGELRRQILRTANATRFMPPLKRGNRYFYVTFDAGATRANAWLQRGSDGEPEPLIAAGMHLREGEVLHRRVWPSPDGRLLAYGVVGPASRWMELRFLDVQKGEVLPDRMSGLVAMSSTVSWAADSSSIYYERFALPEPAERLQSPLYDENVLQHALRSGQEDDRVVYDSRDPENDVIAQTLSDDGRFLVVTVRDGRESHHRVRAMDTSMPAGGFRELVPGLRARFGFVGAEGDEIWLQTDFEAPRGRVIAVDWRRPEGISREIVSERPVATIDTWVGARALGEGPVVGYRKDSRLFFDYFDADGNRLGRFEPPNLGSVWTGLVGRQGSNTVFLTVSSFADPGSVYRLNLQTGERTLFRQPELSYDPKDIVVEQRFYEGATRERVPMFLAYHSDTPPDGSRPVMMYGYGFGGWIAAPWFRPHLPRWFLSGGAFALPALRGGGEYGESWRRAGAATRKSAAVDDYITAAEWLVDAGLVRPSLLVAETNSAGGPVVGASILRRPDLFGAAILGFPLLDMLGYENYTHAGRWRSELGSVRNPEEFAALVSYSPPHNVAPETCYPPVLLTPGARDEITPPMHAYKFAAALQHAGDCENPALLRVSWSAGHAYGATPQETAANLADQLVFLRKVLELP